MGNGGEGGDTCLSLRVKNKKKECIDFCFFLFTHKTFFLKFNTGYFTEKVPAKLIMQQAVNCLVDPEQCCQLPSKYKLKVDI